jgi:hypothetical protein
MFKLGFRAGRDGSKFLKEPWTLWLDCVGQLTVARVVLRTRAKTTGY